MGGVRRGLLLFWILLGILGGSGCGEVTWFVFWNTGTIDDAQASGAVLVIGTPREDPPESVRLISGEIPPGMRLMQDATVRGIPETSGMFLMDIEVIEATEARDVLHYEVEIE